MLHNLTAIATSFYLLLAGVGMPLLVAATVIFDNAETITVQRLDDSKISGQIDAETDADFLCIRQTEPGLALIRSITWDQIKNLQRDGEELTPDQFRELIGELASEIPVQFFERPTSAVTEKIPEPSGRHQALSGQTGQNRRLNSLHASAWLANWDRDVEPDGLEVELIPHDADGQPLALDGVVRLRLTGWQPDTYDPMGTRAFPELALTTVRIRSEDFHSHSTRVRIPFRELNPEHDVQLLAYGQLHVEFNANHLGLVAASISVRVRAFNPLRDRLQLKTGSRFFTEERTGGWSGNNHILAQRWGAVVQGRR